MTQDSRCHPINIPEGGTLGRCPAGYPKGQANNYLGRRTIYTSILGEYQIVTPDPKNSFIVNITPLSPVPPDRRPSQEALARTSGALPNAIAMGKILDDAWAKGGK